MRFLFSAVLLTSLCLAGTITPNLAVELADAQPDELIPVLVKPHGRVDPGYLASVTAGMDRDTQREFVCDALKAKAEETQAGILAYLDGVSTGVDNIMTLWLVNCVVLEATPDVIRGLASLEDVQYVRFRPAMSPFIQPLDVRPADHGDHLDGKAIA